MPASNSGLREMGLGEVPQNPVAWGWRSGEQTYGGPAGPLALPRWEAQGRRVGWLDANGLFLQPDAAFAEAQEMARHQGESLPVSPRTLWRRLRERGLLASWDATRKRNTVRRTLEGVKEREVLHLSPEALSPCIRPSEPSDSAPELGETRENRTLSPDGESDSRRVGRPGPSNETVRKNGQIRAEMTIVGHSGHSNTGEEGPGAPEISPDDEAADWGEV